MKTIFSLILSNCLPAGILLLAVFVSRVVLHRAPRRVISLFWILAALRLIVPFSPESSLSLQPKTTSVSMPFTQREGEASFVSEQIKPVVSLSNRQNVTTQPAAQGLKETARQEKTDIDGLLFAVWLLGMAAMLVYAASGSIRVWKMTKKCVLFDDRVMVGSSIQIPFVFGLFNPMIYLPAGLSEKEQLHVLAHEKTHLKRGDQFKKPFGFLLLTIYWFHPLVWIAWILFCRDLEAACDEEVVGLLDRNGRADYAEALLRCSTGSRIPSPCPVAFGEISVRSRIKKVLLYKKPSSKLALCTVAVCAVLSACFMTVPASNGDTVRLRKVTKTNDTVQMEVTYHLGDQVKSYIVSAEYWEDGKLTRLITIRPENTKGTLYLSMRENVGEEGNSFDVLFGFQKQFSPAGMMIPLTDDVLDWTCFTQPEKVALSAVSEKDLILAVISFDTGNGIHPQDCTALTEDVSTLENEPGSLLVFRLYPSTEESPDMSRFWTPPALTIEEVEAFAAQGSMTWEDLASYSIADAVHEEGWTRFEYGMEEPFSLMVSGNPDASAPTEVLLCAGDDTCPLFADELPDFIVKYRQGLIPTEADLEGFFDLYLFLPTENGTIRYIWADTEKKYTKERLLGEFVEDESAENLKWKVYSVEEDPQQRILCAVSTDGMEIVLQYCPARAAEEESLEQAKQEGALVLEDGEITWGLSTAEDFARRTAFGQESRLTVINWYSALDPETCSKEYYDANQEDYPLMYKTEVFFAGDVYYVEQEEGRSRQYLYLRELTDNSGREHMVLTDNATASYEEMLNSLFSSQVNAGTGFYEIY